MVRRALPARHRAHLSTTLTVEAEVHLGVEVVTAPRPFTILADVATGQ